MITRTAGPGYHPTTSRKALSVAWPWQVSSTASPRTTSVDAPFIDVGGWLCKHRAPETSNSSVWLRLAGSTVPLAFAVGDVNGTLEDRWMLSWPLSSPGGRSIRSDALAAFMPAACFWTGLLPVSHTLVHTGRRYVATPIGAWGATQEIHDRLGRIAARTRLLLRRGRAPDQGTGALCASACRT